eukprot:949494-Prorocentrum_lima.AAC.1
MTLDEGICCCAQSRLPHIQELGALARVVRRLVVRPLECGVGLWVIGWVVAGWVSGSVGWQ